jgi:hypothetical protein
VFQGGKLLTSEEKVEVPRSELLKLIERLEDLENSIRRGVRPPSSETQSQ